MQDNVIDGLAAAAVHPVTVQAIIQGPGIWGNVATGFITAGAAILAVILTHRYTLRREKQAAEQKRRQERLFIATELIFLLEQYAEDCAQVASDEGDGGKQPERATVIDYPAPLNFNDVAGDWRSLPSQRMYEIRELPLRQAETIRAIEYARKHDTSVNLTEFFRARQNGFARLGISANKQAGNLRKLCGLPDARPSTDPWSAQPVMVKVRDREWDERFDQIVARHNDKQKLPDPDGPETQENCMNELYERGLVNEDKAG